MAPDEVRLFLIDPGGRELGRYAIVHPAPLRVGQEIWLDLEGERTLCRVVRERQVGAERRVHVIAVQLRCPFCHARLLVEQGAAGLEQDVDGDFVSCRCGRRVAMERIPTTPRGGPVRLRVAADQPGRPALE